MRVALEIHGKRLDNVKTYDLLSNLTYTHHTYIIQFRNTASPTKFLFPIGNDDNIDGIYDTLKECTNLKMGWKIGLHIP